MAKIKSTQHLLDLLDGEMSHRQIEVTQLKLILKSKLQSREKSVLAKSLILISYSNWEGFVKLTSKKYLEYIKFLGLDLSQLSSQLSSACLFNNLCKSSSSTSEKIDLIHQVLTDDRYKHTMDADKMSDAESNLNYSVLQKIVANIGLDRSRLNVDHNFLDSIILKNRNVFAHGDNEYVDCEKAIEIADKCLEYMRQYKTLIENALTLKSYLKSSII